MNKTTIKKYPIYRSSIFRNPVSAEKKLGLWVDRVGGGVEEGIQTRLRLLGMYGAVRVEGKGGIFINAETGEKRVKNGDIMLLFPNIPSLYYPYESWLVKWVLWNGPEADLLCELGYVSPEKPVVQNCPAMLEFHSALKSNIQSEDMGAILERKNIIISLVQELFRAANHSGSANDLLMERAVEFINSSTKMNLSIKDLASRFNLSSTQFRRVFKTFTGRSPKEYILSYKITQAKKLLLEGKPIKDVADELDFCDVFHFMRTFKKIAGINPGQFF